MTTLHRWTEFGKEWACACYDHGAFCRLCQPVEGTLALLLGHVDNGLMEVVGAASDGDIRFRLTPAGEAAARDAITRMGGDPDDESTILPALKNDIAKSN